MESKNCPKLRNCPIFEKNVLHNELIGQTYKNLYCLAEEDKFTTCKRYIFSEKYKKGAPENVMPNSSLSIEEILQKIEVKV